jgi:hypothetical protein
VVALGGASSNAFPTDSFLSSPAQVQGDGETAITGSVFARRGRETAVFDRWIAVRVGSELRAVESELSEEGEGEREILARLQVR